MSAILAAHLCANRACCTLNVAESWLDETPRFLLLFCGVPRFLVTSLLVDRPKNAYILIKSLIYPQKRLSHINRKGGSMN